MLRSFILRLVCALAVTAITGAFLTVPAAAEVQHSQAKRDGSRDFDFEIGTWKTHSQAALAPADGFQGMGRI